MKFLRAGNLNPRLRGGRLRDLNEGYVRRRESGIFSDAGSTPAASTNLNPLLNQGMPMGKVKIGRYMSLKCPSEAALRGHVNMDLVLEGVDVD